jgi:hypothetical protein
MYNVALGRVGVTTAAVEKQYYIFWWCVCSLPLVIRRANRIFSAHHYIAICGLYGSTIFSHVYPINGTLKKINIRWSCLGWIISHSTTKWARYHECTDDVKYPCHASTKLEFSWQISQNILKHYVSRKSVQWKTSCSIRAGGRTDRRDEATSLFSLKRL